MIVFMTVSKTFSDGVAVDFHTCARAYSSPLFGDIFSVEPVVGFQCKCISTITIIYNTGLDLLYNMKQIVGLCMPYDGGGRRRSRGLRWRVAARIEKYPLWKVGRAFHEKF